MKATVSIMPKREILDPQSRAVANALERLGFQGVKNLRQGKHVTIELDEINPDRAFEVLEEMCRALLVNELIEEHRIDVQQSADETPEKAHEPHLFNQFDEECHTYLLKISELMDKVYSKMNFSCPTVSKPNGQYYTISSEEVLRFLEKRAQSTSEINKGRGLGPKKSQKAMKESKIEPEEYQPPLFNSLNKSCHAEQSEVC